jgi:hypothetical protein
MGSKCANRVTQVTAKWKSLAGSGPDSTAPAISTAGSGATDLAFEFPINGVARSNLRIVA